MQKLTDAVEETNHITKLSTQKPVQTNPLEKQKQFAMVDDETGSTKYASKD